MTKEELIIKAATGLFLEKGFGGVSMEEIARKAGVAKQTLYSYFNGKEALFKAIVRRRCEAVFDALPEGSGNHSDMKSYLATLGNRVMDILFTEETIELYRLVVAETPRFPELGHMYYETGPKAAVDMLAAYFQRCGVKKGDSRAWAEQFFGMLTGSLLNRALLDVKLTLSRAERQKTAERTAAFFLLALNSE